MKTEETLKNFKELVEYFDELKTSKENTISSNLGVYPLDYSYEEGFLELAFRVTPFMINSLNCMHGGLIATICDISMGHLCYALNGQRSAPTASLTVNYLSSAYLGDLVVSKAYCKKLGSTLVSLYCEMYHYESKKMIATATANFCILKPREN